MVKAFISGCSGTDLTAAEISFFKREEPWGLILFRRNCETPDQVKGLVNAFRAAVGRNEAPVLIDQEGGRVQRLRPPHWPKYPPAARYGDLYNLDPVLGKAMARLGARLIAHDLRALGISVNCTPLLDVRRVETVDAIGDRAFSEDPFIVAELGREVVCGMLSGGILPVIKHLPGHGRARVDSHLDLPRVEARCDELESADFIPFQQLSDCCLGMTAHILFTDIDDMLPSTQSREVVQSIIRGRIGFDGVLMSDDISMKALDGDMRERCHAVFAAGCDLVLHCNGDLREMEAVAEAAPALTGVSALRCQTATEAIQEPDLSFDVRLARAELQRNLGETLS